MANGNRKRNSSGGIVVKATLAALVLLIMAATLAVNFGGRANATGGGAGRSRHHAARHGAAQCAARGERSPGDACGRDPGAGDAQP